MPLFRQGDFYGGINAGLDQIIRIVDGEPLPPPDLAWQGASEKSISHLVPFLFVAVLFGSAVLRSMFGRGLGALIAGAATGALVYFAGQSLFVAMVAGVLAFLFALISGFSGAACGPAIRARAGGAAVSAAAAAVAWGGGPAAAADSAGGGGGFQRRRRLGPLVSGSDG